MAISREKFDTPKGTVFSITASFGITELTPNVRASDAIISADHAMYAAKHAGRNKVIFDTDVSRIPA